MFEWWNDEMIQCQNDVIIELWNDGLLDWLIDIMIEQWNDERMEWWNIGMDCLMEW